MILYLIDIDDMRMPSLSCLAWIFPRIAWMTFTSRHIFRVRPLELPETFSGSDPFQTYMFLVVEKIENFEGLDLSKNSHPKINFQVSFKFVVALQPSMLHSVLLLSTASELARFIAQMSAQHSCSSMLWDVFSSRMFRRDVVRQCEHQVSSSSPLDMATRSGPCLPEMG